MGLGKLSWWFIFFAPSVYVINDWAIQHVILSCRLRSAWTHPELNTLLHLSYCLALSQPCTTKRLSIESFVEDAHEKRIEIKCCWSGSRLTNILGHVAKCHSSGSSSRHCRGRVIKIPVVSVLRPNWKRPCYFCCKFCHLAKSTVTGYHKGWKFECLKYEHFLSLSSYMSGCYLPPWVFPVCWYFESHVRPCRAFLTHAIEKFFVPIVYRAEQPSVFHL